MAFALLIIGLLMIAVGGRGTYAQFGTMVVNDFTVAPSGGGPTFAVWLIALAAVGAVGFVSSLQTISRMMLGLVLLVLILRNKGFFDQFKAALAQGPTTPQPIPTSNTAPSSSGFGMQPGTASPSNPSGQPTINFGPLGTLNTNPFDPSVWGTSNTLPPWLGGGNVPSWLGGTQ